jgi:excisionase family DNA binding protein
MMMEPALMRITEAAAYLAIGRSLTYELLKRRELPTVHIGASVRIPTEAVKEWVRARTQLAA